VRSYRQPILRTLSRELLPGVPLWFALAAGAGLLLRAALLFQYLRTPFGGATIGDERAYWTWAERLAAERWRGGGVFYQGPLFPYLLAAAKTAWAGFGQGALAAFQLALNWLTCLLLVPPLVARAGRTRALAAAATALFFSPAVFLALKGLPTTLGLFLLVAALAAAAPGTARQRTRAAAGGLLTGLALLAVPSLLPLAPVLAVAAARAAPRRERAAALFLFGLAAALAISPAAVHNYRRDGSLLPISSNFGIVFAQGNHPQGDGTYTALAGVSSLGAREGPDAARIATREAGRPLNQGEVSRHFLRSGLAFVRAEPGRWALLEARKAALLLAGLDVPLEFSLARERRDGLPLLWAFPVGGTVAVLLALAALCAPGRGRPVRLYLLLGGTGAAVCVLFYVAGRYACPAYFLLLPAAAALPDAVRAPGRRWRLALPALAVGAALAYAGPALSGPAWETDHLQKTANAFERQGRPREALAAYERWARVEPGSPLLHRRLGEFYLRNGQPEDAELYARRAAELRPGEPAVLLLLARVFVAMDRTDEAIALLERLLAADGTDTAARLVLAEAHLRAGRTAEARGALEAAVRLDPGSTAARDRLAALSGKGAGGAGGEDEAAP
jgi:tetratricopeptide (TPR) repeat protein